MRKSNNLVKALLLCISPWTNNYQFTSAESDDDFGIVKHSSDVSHTSLARKLAEDDLVADYDSEFTAPRCFDVGASCNTWFKNGGVGRIANGGYENNAPNTIDGCEDYSIGTRGQDESIESMKVASGDGAFLSVGEEVQIEAYVFKAKDTSSRSNPNEKEYGHFWYAPDAKSKDWSHIGSSSFDPGSGGLMRLVLHFTLQPGDSTQAVRLTYGYAESRYMGPCHRMDNYFDVDDLVFEVNHGAIPKPSFQYIAPLASPPPNYSKSIAATYDSEYTVPRCFEHASLCHSGFVLISGVGDEEENSPNTIDSCADTTGSSSQKFESIFFMTVQSVTKEIMTVGDWVSVTTSVISPTDTSLRAMPADHQFIIHFYYKSDVVSSWKYITSRFRQPGLDSGLFSVKYKLPAGSVHVVRVIYGYGPFIVGPCVRSWEYYDVDDLMFAVVDPSLTFPLDVEGELLAVYDSEFTAPRCIDVGPSCDSSSLIVGVGGSVGDGTESNSPNTIDGCEDYSIGTRGHDESIERMRVRSVEGGPLSVGKEAVFEIFVYTATDTSGRPNPHEKEIGRFWYTPDVISKDWSEIDFKQIDAESGLQLLSTRFMIQPGDSTQAVRLSYGYSDSAVAGPCHRMDNYFDVDDLVFAVDHGSIPKPSFQYIYTQHVPSPSPVTETVAKYDSKFSIPRCAEYSVACNTGFDLIWNVGDEEPNFPNSIDTCSDSTGPTAHKFEAVRYISVRSTKDTIMTVGDWVSIIARVYSPNDKSLRPMPEDNQFILHFYYTSDFEPRWKYIASRFRKPGDSWFEVKHMLPKGSLHAVRVIYGYGTFAVGPCVKSWKYYDVDDLVFAVKDPSSPPLTNPPTQSPTLGPTRAPVKPPSKSPTQNNLNPQSNLYVAQYDNVLKAPRCRLGSHCDSGTFLLGVGSNPLGGPEQNAPNSIDDCPGENHTRSSAMLTPIFHHDESVDKISIHTLEESGPLSVGMEVEAEITVYSADDTSLRSNPNKWSLAHVYYSSNAKNNGDDVTWKYLWTETVEPGLGRHVFKVRFVLKSFLNDGDSDDGDDNVDFGNGSIATRGASTSDQAIRVNYGYAQYKVSSCPNDVVNPYLDVDDLIFEVLESHNQNGGNDDEVESGTLVTSSSSYLDHTLLQWTFLVMIPLAVFF